MQHVIANPTATHPHAYTLGLLRLGIDTLPPSFDTGKIAAYRRSVEKFERNPGTPYDEIQKVIVRVGKESWAERKAYEEMYARYGRASEEAFLLENLDMGIREKYETFLHDGGKLSYIEKVQSEADLMAPSPFERYFTPEEKYAIGQALLVARDQAHSEISGLVAGAKSEEFTALVEEYEGKKARIEAMIDELKSYLGLSERWEAQLRDRIRTIEEGWSIVERGMTEERMEQEVEYWRGTLESFLHE